MAAPTAPSTYSLRPVRPGELTFGWRIVVALTWAGAFFSYAAVWKASVELGLSTWWLGPSADQNPVVIRILPFVLPVIMSLAAVYGVRRLPLYGVAASLVGAAIGYFDLDRAQGLGVTELIIAAATLIVSLAAITGRFRSGAAPIADEPDGAEVQSSIANTATKEMARPATAFAPEAAAAVPNSPWGPPSGPRLG